MSRTNMDRETLRQFRGLQRQAEAYHARLKRINARLDTILLRVRAARMEGGCPDHGDAKVKPLMAEFRQLTAEYDAVDDRAKATVREMELITGRPA